LEDIKKKNLGKESEGAFLIFFPDETKLNPLMITKKDGSSLYALRDLATDKWRKKEYGDDIKIINEVGTEQSEYFKQIFEAEEMLGYFTREQRVHLAHGLYRFKDGKMSTRKGNVIWLDDIINEAISRASAINKDVDEEVGIGAIKFNDLKRESKKDIIFDWEEIINLNGDSGPYSQYSYARAKSILGKAKGENIKIETTVPEGWGTTEEEKLLNRFPEIVVRSAEDLAPQQIANYLINLARAFNTFYGNSKIVDKDDPKSPYKLAITEAFSIVIKNGLNLLGIKAPEKM
jgi:arginyl-tRNA synthetase